ncbi:hypothetical protein [Azospirillum argentinense]
MHPASGNSFPRPPLTSRIHAHLFRVARFGHSTTAAAPHST